MTHRALNHSLIALLAAFLAGCSAWPTGAFAPSAPRGKVVPGEVIVAWARPENAPEAYGRLGLRLLAGEGTSRQLVAVPEGEELAWCRRLQGMSGVELAEPNYVRATKHIPGSLKPARRLHLTPNDAGFSAPSPLRSQGASWGLKAINAEGAWDVTAGDPSVRVAVIDTGVDMAHPDLRANLDTAGAFNFLERGRPVDDDFGHGTHVAGIIAAVGNNTLGSLGVAWKTRVMPLRVLGVDGSGSMYDTLSAMDHALSRGARIINLSLGSPDYSEIEARKIRDVINAGVVVVAAAGNEATDGNYLSYPACYPGVLSVGAVGPDLQKASFSNFNSQVALAAPGVDIFSTLPSRLSRDPYGYLSGTSMAAPMVAGAAALVFARHPDWKGAQVAEHLMATARDLSAPSDLPGFDVYFGYGLVDAQRAVSE